MEPFEFVAAESLSQASSLLLDDPDSTRAIAGGTDILDEIKEGLIGPRRLVSLAGASEYEGVTAGPTGLVIGALTTLHQIESHPEIVRHYPALAQAAASVATPQIRNVGTLGGNLCQRPRCWYYRSPLFDCLKKGGATCFALNGNNKLNAILGGGDCIIVHPSDLAVALISLRAEVSRSGPGGLRKMRLEQFFAGPDRNVMTETVLEAGEVLAQVSVPRSSPQHRSIYLKATERQGHDFALASVAVAMEVSNGRVDDALITLGGVAPTPLRVPRAEDELRGRNAEEVEASKIGELGVRDARPLRDNRFKVPLTSSLVSRAIETLLAGDSVPDSPT